MDSVMFLAVAIAVMRLLEEELFGDEVDSKSSCSNAKAREGALESIPPCERACVSPCLTVAVLDLCCTPRALLQLTFSSRDLLTSIAGS